MKPRTIFLDSFSGSAADLKGRRRTPENILAALAKDPMVSTFDMSEHYRWLPTGIDSLVKRGLIVALPEPYPWHRYALTAAGRSVADPKSGGAA